jgi:hypothetical protein
MTSTIVKRILLTPIIFTTLAGCGEDVPDSAVATSPIRINEVNPDNEVYQDMVGDTDDWIELYNDSDADVPLENYYISDSSSKRFKDQFVAETVIKAHDVLLVWADGELTQNSYRSPHVSFKLSDTGEGVWLSDPDGYLVDKIEFIKMPVNPTGGQWTSYARYPNGTGDWMWCTESTPDELNGDACQGTLL